VAELLGLPDARAVGLSRLVLPPELRQYLPGPHVRVALVFVSVLRDDACVSSESPGGDDGAVRVAEHFQADAPVGPAAVLGEVLTRLGRKDEARAIYEKGIGQSEKLGHSGMAEDLRLAIIQLN
jgi:hypothetical protein